MKEEILEFLRKNDNWKEFISLEANVRARAKISSIDIVTLFKEGEYIYFDVSIIYKVDDVYSKQVYEPGIAVLDEKENIIMVNFNIS